MQSSPERLFTIWNKKLHYYTGLYLLLFLWLFALSGLLLNHSSWAFSQFYPNRKITRFDRPIQLPAEPAAIMQQLGIHGELRTNPGRLDFNVARPGIAYQVQIDSPQGIAKVTLNEYNTWGIIRTLHTFVGDNWTLTTVWAYSMDAIALGVAFMALSSIYMWWKLPTKRIPGAIALTLGILACALFLFGLRWLYA